MWVYSDDGVYAGPRAHAVYPAWSGGIIRPFSPKRECDAAYPAPTAKDAQLNQKQQIRSYESSATVAYMQGQEPMQYIQPEAEESFDHSHKKPSVMQQTQLPQQRTPN